MIVSVVAYFDAKVGIKIEMTKKKKKNPFYPYNRCSKIFSSGLTRTFSEEKKKPPPHFCSEGRFLRSYRFLLL